MSQRSQAASGGSSLLHRLLRPRGKATTAENRHTLPPETSPVEGLPQELETIEKHLSRIDREQFKARALAEAQMQQFTAALEMLRAADARRESEIDRLRTQSQAEKKAARLEVVQALLPALDGLDEALRSGEHLLEQHREPLPQQSVLARLFAPPTPRDTGDGELRVAMVAWLAGLTFVRQRLLDVLAAEGVQPIVAEGRPFDPHYHVALEVVRPTDSLPAGTIGAELRRGYLAEGRVLRYAEVAVAGEGSA